ncbi:MAG: Crp/Fnr family transcriptional regulator [Rubrivivax sp.]|nr:Crp/Fnr family transcriptional regulator [Rubrivivax sp.]
MPFLASPPVAHGAAGPRSAHGAQGTNGVHGAQGTIDVHSAESARAAHGADRPALVLLRGIALLQDLGDDVLHEVAEICRFQRVRARQTVMTRADSEHDCCFVLAGRLKVVALSPGGREISFRDARAGEMIGEMAALDGRPRSATVVAQEESLLARLRPTDFRLLLRRHWSICDRLLQHLARTARTLTERVYELSALNVHQRLCAELLRLALGASASPPAPAGAPSASAPSAPSTPSTPSAPGAPPAPGTPRELRVALRPAPSHAELAMRISCTREQVAREMSDLARLGVIHCERKPGRESDQIVIDDLRRLAERIEAAAPRAPAALRSATGAPLASPAPLAPLAPVEHGSPIARGAPTDLAP